MFADIRRSMVRLQCPPEEGLFRRHNGRLAMFRPRAVLDQYWTNHWKDDERRARLLEKSRDRELVEYEPLFAKYMAREGLVLEAGCGLSQVVAALKRRGYSVRGIEYDREVVAYVNQRFPELDVVVGDVNALQLPDRSVRTYVSLGVVEHFPEGPLAALKEARRVLTRDGFALISVPVLNHARANYLRNIDATFGDERGDLSFYQYYFSESEFVELGRLAGLECVDARGIFLETHVANEHPFFARLWRTRLGRSRLRNRARRAMSQAPDWARHRYGHMVMFVFRPL